MKLTKFCCLLGIAAMLFSSCKKETTNNPAEQPAAVDANGNLRPADDANGACYSIKSRLYDDNAGIDFTDFNYAYGWFGSMTAFKNAGAVSVNTFDLTNFGGFNTYQFFGFERLYPSNAAAWIVEGDAASGVPGFTYTDNSAFPTGGDFTLPAAVSLSTPLTVNFAPVTNVTGVVFSLKGNKGQKNKGVANGASSVTFTSAELNEVAFTNDQIAVSIMPVTMVPQTLNGKKIYFVKQFQYARETATL